MPDPKELASKPSGKAPIYVLCIDGTGAADSAAFFDYVQKAGKAPSDPRKRVTVLNLLDLLGKEPAGTIESLTPSKSGDDESPFPFDAEDMKTLPIERISMPGTRVRSE